MTKKVVGIRFKKAGKIYYFDPLDYDLKQYDHAIVETVQGLEYGEVAIAPREVDDQSLKAHVKPVLRKATDQDDREYQRVQKKQKEGGRIFEDRVRANHLDMKLVNVEYTFDMRKAVFYFTADGRVDFRDLVKDLASVLKMRIELRQIGVRDEVKMFSTLGVCGRNTCCSQWLGDFAPVSIRMAKEQGMSLNSTKISGVCGRLLCCLSYEHDFYKEVTKKMPRVGQKVITPDGEGTVFRLGVLEETVSVRLEKDNGEAEIKSFDLSDLVRVNGKAYSKVFDDADEAADEDIPEELKALEDAPAEEPAKKQPKKQPKAKDNKGKNTGKKPQKKGGAASDKRTGTKKNNFNQNSKKMDVKAADLLDSDANTAAEQPKAPAKNHRSRRRKRNKGGSNKNPANAPKA